MSTQARPAFYALAPGSWRDYVTLLHPPYTLWHLSYVAIGATLAPRWRPGILGLALLAFFLGMGVAAHALDELVGRPLQTRIPERVLVALAAFSIGAAIAIGIAAAIAWNLWLLVFVVIGGFVVVAYNLELLGGVLHNHQTFALSWGAFPLLTGYFASAGRITWEALLASAFAALSSAAQRVLSTPVRLVRRRVRAVSGTLELTDGTAEHIDAQRLISAPETALRLLAAAIVALAGALLVLRLR